MPRNRNFRALLAAVSTIAWIGYMAVGLAVINAMAPTVAGEGPEGAAAFIGLIWGVVTIGLIMWWASD